MSSIKTGLFVVALAWAMAGCGANREMKIAATSVLDVANQLYFAGCLEEEVIQEDLCVKSDMVLGSYGQVIDKEAAKRRALQAFLQEKVVPVVLPYLEDGGLTLLQLGLAYVFGDLLSGALSVAGQ